MTTRQDALSPQEIAALVVEERGEMCLEPVDEGKSTKDNHQE